MHLIALLTAALCTAFLFAVFLGTSCAKKHRIVFQEFFTGVVPMTCLPLGACLLVEHSPAGLFCFMFGGTDLFVKLTEENVSGHHFSTETLLRGTPTKQYLHGGDA